MREEQECAGKRRERTPSRCLASLQDSIDQAKRLGKPVFAAEAHFPCSYGVDGRVDAPAELLQLLGSEDELADGGLAAPEDEIVGAEAGDLDLRLLERDEVLQRLGLGPVPVLERRLQLAQLVLGSGELKELRSRIHTAVYTVGNQEVSLRSEDGFPQALRLVDAILDARQAA